MVFKSILMKETNILLVIGSLATLISIQAGATEPTKLDPPQNQAGYRAYIDPDTGQLTSPPTPQARKSLPLNPNEQNAMSTSHTGLSQENIPGKGVKLNLQGRFQSSTFATIEDSGEVSISHSKDGNPSPIDVQDGFQKQGE